MALYDSEAEKARGSVAKPASTTIFMDDIASQYRGKNTSNNKKERLLGFSFLLSLQWCVALKKVQFLASTALFLVHIKIYS